MRFIKNNNFISGNKEYFFQAVTILQCLARTGQPWPLSLKNWMH